VWADLTWIADSQASFSKFNDQSNESSGTGAVQISFLTKLPRERYSPDAFGRFVADNGGFSLGTARAMAWMSQLAYETDEPNKIASIAATWSLKIPNDGIVSEEIITVLPKVSTQIVVGVRGTAAIIAFAGTDPIVLADWITNFDVGTTRSGAAKGFNVALEAVWSKLSGLLQGSLAGKTIFVTGHSLGGALAVLAAQRIEARKVNVRAVYTFGMPRVGDSNFAALYNQALGSRTYRLVHGDDVVPTVAPSELGFSHVGRYLRCARQSKFAADALASTTDSDDPKFVTGISGQLRELLNRPLSTVMSAAKRLKLAAALAFGFGPAALRKDAGGILIELLPPPLRDHMPDRYIAATWSGKRD
jgi:triacylglycerol lipase